MNNFDEYPAENGSEPRDFPETQEPQEQKTSAETSPSQSWFNLPDNGWQTPETAAGAEVQPQNSEPQPAPEPPASSQPPVPEQYTAAAAPAPRHTQPPQQQTTYTGGWQTPSPPQYIPPQYMQPQQMPPQPSPYSNNPYGWQYTPQQKQSPQQAYPQSSQKPLKPKRSGMLVFLAVVGILCTLSLVVAGALLADNSSSGSNAGSQTNSPSENAPSIVTLDPAKEGMHTRDIVKANLDSTVVITMYDQVSSMFGGGTGAEQVVGGASGIVWTEDGYIITNAHVVYNDNVNPPRIYKRIMVKLYDETEYEAKVVGYDTNTDLAVIKIEPEKKLDVAQMGDSAQLELGDKVVALGNNSGLDWSVTEGIVSGLNRDVYEETRYNIKCIQTDAAINPGNSGGPLLNSSGQVVGINSSKIMATGYEGLGFSIPINEAKKILEDLVKFNYVKGRVKLGITGRTFNQVGMEGFRIESIDPDSSLTATRARAGDIITHVNEIRVRNYTEMSAELIKYSVGDVITLSLIHINFDDRSTSTIDVEVELVEDKMPPR
ncbi:MAG: trypsin-like peptidase domain-containing protein [Oscillospiraceae bacterium]|nr:trypsin-like peptidase domain-containing protein [Oscillospiraceae bacterium]